ncbi:MAG: bifunctional riboflavin kinase/FAD synthetase [Candidatus Latescibacteria bacterium]|nr:bifunctional riboflavin kinase/FAD synthetase [Candidatus Latescibacterota bacterium]
MKICRNRAPSETRCGIRTSATLGTFDGVHIGHREILGKVVSYARESGFQAAAITFDRHPQTVLDSERTLRMITTLDEKLDLMERTGLDIVYVITFSEEISRMSPSDFIGEYLVECLGMRHFVVGYDHGFGRNRTGGPGMIAILADEYGFTLEIVQPVLCEGETVNSSIIRELINQGRMDKATLMLGRDFSFSGSVVSGYGYGKKLGVPTSNIEVEDDLKIMPGQGVYTGWLEHGGAIHEAVISIGSRPTFGYSDEAIEVHMPDFDGDLYGERVTVGVTGHIRDIVRFDSKDELVEQIKKDIDYLYQHTSR